MTGATGCYPGRTVRRTLAAIAAVLSLDAAADPAPDLQRHQRMVSESAALPPGDSQDGRCRICHAGILDEGPRAVSPAGLRGDGLRASYQTLGTYAGPQASFHWRHRLSPYARQVMRLQCQSCHGGRDPAEPIPARDDPEHPLVLRKLVNPALCINCHGAFPDHRASIAGTGRDAGKGPGNCLTCHETDRDRRHRSRLLDKDAIERMGEASSDVCLGCHGGRAWYAVTAAAIRGGPYDMGRDVGSSAGWPKVRDLEELVVR